MQHIHTKVNVWYPKFLEVFQKNQGQQFHTELLKNSQENGKHIWRQLVIIYCKKVYGGKKHQQVLFSMMLKNNSTNLVPHHYRTWSLEAERRNLQSCWEKCLENDSVIPAMMVFTINNRLSINNLSYAKACAKKHKSSR